MVKAGFFVSGCPVGRCTAPYQNGPRMRLRTAL